MCTSSTFLHFLGFKDDADVTYLRKRAEYIKREQPKEIETIDVRVVGICAYFGHIFHYRIKVVIHNSLLLQRKQNLLMRNMHHLVVYTFIAMHFTAVQ